MVPHDDDAVCDCSECHALRRDNAERAELSALRAQVGILKRALFRCRRSRVRHTLATRRRERALTNSDYGTVRDAFDRERANRQAAERENAMLIEGMFNATAKREAAERKLDGVRWCDCGQPWKPAAGLFGTTEENHCPACVLRDMLQKSERKLDESEAELLAMRTRAFEAEARIESHFGTTPRAKVG